MPNDDVIHFYWNPKSRMYEEGDRMELDGEGGYGPAYTAPEKKKLEDVSTRFVHLNDLTDYLSEGLIAVTNSLERYKNDSDVGRKAKLEGALSLIHIYQEQMANYSDQKWAFNRMLDENVPTKETLALIRQEKADQKSLGDSK